MTKIHDLQRKPVSKIDAQSSGLVTVGWVKDSDVIEDASVRSHLAYNEMLELIVPRCEEGLLQIKVDRRINGEVHRYFQTTTDFALMRTGFTDRSAIRHARDEMEEDELAGSADEDHHAQRNVDLRGAIKRPASPWELPGHTAKRQETCNHQRTNATVWTDGPEENVRWTMHNAMMSHEGPRAGIAGCHRADGFRD